jgi:hypothetical protein
MGLKDVREEMEKLAPVMERVAENTERQAETLRVMQRDAVQAFASLPGVATLPSAGAGSTTSPIPPPQTGEGFTLELGEEELAGGDEGFRGGFSGPRLSQFVEQFRKFIKVFFPVMKSAEERAAELAASQRNFISAYSTPGHDASGTGVFTPVSSGSGVLASLGTGGGAVPQGGPTISGGQGGGVTQGDQAIIAAINSLSASLRGDMGNSVRASGGY